MNYYIHFVSYLALFIQSDLFADRNKSLVNCEPRKMLGEKALDLVKDAARNENNLNPFSEDLVRATIEETRRLWEQNRFVSERI